MTLGFMFTGFNSFNNLVKSAYLESFFFFKSAAANNRAIPIPTPKGPSKFESKSFVILTTSDPTLEAVSATAFVVSATAFAVSDAAPFKASMLAFGSKMENILLPPLALPNVPLALSNKSARVAPDEIP